VARKEKPGNRVSGAGLSENGPGLLFDVLTAGAGPDLPLSRWSGAGQMAIKHSTRWEQQAMAEMDNATKAIIATGVAGFAVTIELLTELNNSRLISDDRLLAIMDGALSAIETVDAANSHEIYRMARSTWPSDGRFPKAVSRRFLRLLHRESIDESYDIGIASNLDVGLRRYACCVIVVANACGDTALAKRSAGHNR
jgi:hypothetical protein